MDQLLLPPSLKNLFVWFFDFLDIFYRVLFLPVAEGLGGETINGQPNPFSAIIQAYLEYGTPEMIDLLTNYSLAYIVFSIGLIAIIGWNIIKFIVPTS